MSTLLEGAPVFVLLRVGGPTTVAWRVVSFVVDTVKREADRLFAHIIKKVFKAVQPPFAYGNAARTIVSVVFSVFVVAPRFHFRPRAKCSAPPAGGVTVSDALFAGSISLEAAARLRVAVSQIGSSRGDFDTADALASPEKKNSATGSAHAMGNAENGKDTAKPIARQGNERFTKETLDVHVETSEG
jgi:hypothetical protein